MHGEVKEPASAPPVSSTVSHAAMRSALALRCAVSTFCSSSRLTYTKPASWVVDRPRACRQRRNSAPSRCLGDTFGVNAPAHLHSAAFRRCDACTARPTAVVTWAGLPAHPGSSR
jgi:hypothetical protein